LKGEKTMMNVYACGGAGVNIAKKIKNGLANVFYIDTSTSNLKDITDRSKVYRVSGMDGAGKDFKVTYENFRDKGYEVLSEFTPSDQLNILLSSTCGGSGGMLSAILATELIRQKKPFVIIGVESFTSSKEMQNTLNLLKTYKGISAKNKANVCVLLENNEDTEKDVRSNREKADKAALTGINIFALLTDRTRTEEFDNADLNNFINFDRVTDNEPSATTLIVCNNEKSAQGSNTHIAAMLHITSSRDRDIVGDPPDYLCTCIVTDPEMNDLDYRIDNVVGGIDDRIRYYEKRIAQHNEKKNFKTMKGVEVSDANEDGFVF
jgi:hypothetical protein